MVLSNPMIDLGQLFCVGFSGTRAPASLLASIRQRQIGGVILFARNLENLAQTQALVQELQEARPDEAPLLVTLDQEGGKVQRWRKTEWPSHETLGAGRPEDTQKIACAIGEEIALLGYNVNFAPVMDVLVEKRNPVMAGRCFSDDPEQVTQHGLAFIRGLHQAGVAACAKHFPGHGRTTKDSHIDLPEVDASREELAFCDLLPFRRAVEEKVDMVMTAHVRYPALDPQWPATLSQSIVSGLLRNKWGYDGVVATDALEMKAVSDRQSMAENAKRALLAGCDLMLICEQEDHGASVREALARAAENDRTVSTRIGESATRVRRLRQSLAAPCEQRFR